MDKDFEFTRWERFRMWFFRTTRISRARYFLTEELPNFIKNVWIFRKSLTNFYWYNMDSTMLFIRDGLNHSIPLFEERGNEIESSKKLKIYKMRRLKWLLDNMEDHNYIEQAEKELGKLFHEPMIFKPIENMPDYYEMVSSLNPEQELHNGKVYDLATKLEEQQWNEIMEILKGNSILNWERDFNGNGIQNWWN